MRYFLMNASKRVVDAPRIINWSEAIDTRNLKFGEYYKLPKRTLLRISPNKDGIFTEVITEPFLLFSKEVHDILLKYEPNMTFKQIVLLDQKYPKTAVYYLPVLEEVDCLASTTTYNWDHSEAVKPVLVRDKLPDEAIFYLDGVRKKQIVVRMDFLESMLRRGAMLDVQMLEIEGECEYGD